MIWHHYVTARRGDQGEALNNLLTLAVCDFEPWLKIAHAERT